MTSDLVGDKDELVGKVSLQNGTRLVTNANDLGVVGVLTRVQFVTNLASHSGMDGATQATIGRNGNEQLLGLSGGLRNLGLFVKVLGTDTVRTSLFQVTFGTSVPGRTDTNIVNIVILFPIRKLGKSIFDGSKWNNKM